MRKLRILSESYVYYKKYMRQMSHSRMCGHQNYREKSFLWARFLLTFAHLKGFGIEYSSYLNSPPSFTLRQPFFSRNLIFIGYCSTNGVSRQMEYRFEFSNPENLEVAYLWWEDRALIVGQQDRWQHWNHFLHNYVCHIDNLGFLFLYILCTIL